MGRETYKKLILIALFFIVLFIFSKTAYTQEINLIQPDDIIITEIMMDPKAVSDTNGEWFEIYNTTNKDIDLTSCSFSDNGSNNFSITTSTIITANGFLVLARNNDVEINGGVISDYTYSGFTLANTEDEIVITCNDIEIDRVEYSLDLNFPITAGRSLMLTDIELDNNTAASWCQSSTTYGLGDFGSPAGPNGDCANITDNNEDEIIDNTEAKNKLPVAKADGDTAGVIDQTLKFNGSESSDPDGDELTFTWDLGDGTIKTGQSITHNYSEVGVYQVKLTVNDGRDSQTDYLTVKITGALSTNFKDKIIINELLPNPQGPDNEEWIELKNISNQTINLNGLILADATDKTYTLSFNDYDDLNISPQEFFLVYKEKSKLSLNNNPPETVKLLQPDSQKIDSVTYTTTAKENYAYALIENDWIWTDAPTPNKNNILTIQNSPNQTASSTASTSSQAIFDKQTNTDDDCHYTTSSQIILSELWPSPQGDDREFEFIELKNNENQKITLCGWKINDKTNSYELPEETTIPANGFLIISRKNSKLSLNNTGDIIELYDFNNKLIDKTEYQKAKTDLSWSRNQTNQWSWTSEITPEEENIFTADETNNEKKSDNKKTYSNSYIATPIDEINNFAANQKLIIEGWVTTPPGLLGSQIMYIAGSGGLQIYQYQKDWPEIKLNDHVRIQGTLSYPYDRPRLKMSSHNDLVKLDSNNNAGPPKPLNLKIDELNDDLVGSLIIVGGEIIEKTKTKIFIDDGSAEIEVYIKSSTGIVLPDLEEGDILEVTGILNKTSDHWQLLPRFTADIKFVQVAGWESSENKVDFIDDHQQFRQTTNFLYITLSGLIILFSGLIYKIRKIHG